MGGGALTAPITDWAGLKALALSLDLPEVTLALPWGHEALKAHGKMWCWWSPYVEAAVFKADKAEREMLMQADPDTFFLHPHYAPHNLVLVRAGRIDPGWATARLIRDWRDAAPKRWLKAWDAAQT
jgi:hypothetical protein